MLLFFAASMGLNACTTLPGPADADTKSTLDVSSSLFGERPPIATSAEIHALSPEQERDFLAFFHHPDHQTRRGHQRVIDYLKLKTSGFGYRGDTYTATEALEASAGNCLSLAIVTTALARLADVEIGYQLIDWAPVFESGRRQIRRSRHVRSVLYDPTFTAPKGFFALMRPQLKVDYFPDELDRFVGTID